MYVWSLYEVLENIEDIRYKEGAPNVSMTNRYVVEETFAFFTKYLNLHKYSHYHIWTSNEEELMKALVVEGSWKSIHFFEAKVKKLHNYIILHDSYTTDM